MKTTSAMMSLLLLSATVGGQPAVLPAKQAATPAALQAEIEALRPVKHVWREITWKLCPLEALQAARAHNKPIIAWVFLGVPTDERC